MSSVLETELPVTGEAIFESWINDFGNALERRDPDALSALFDGSGYWKDILSFTWEHRTFDRDTIRTAFEHTLDRTMPSKVLVSTNRTEPRLLRRAGRTVVEGFFDFETAVGHGAGFVRLLHNEADPLHPRIWLLLTTLQELDGYPAQTGKGRPSGDRYARNTVAENWLDDRNRAASFEDREPEVLVVGAGHAGLILAARLGQMGVDALVIEKAPRVGNVWRERYHSLTLHNRLTANHMPYVPFPETWPVWLSKDKLAGWLESYAEFLELNIWTSTELLTAEYDEAEKIWTAHIRRDGQEQVVRCRHLVVATGVTGSIPNIPTLEGIEDFAGEVIHSGQYKRGAAYAGKNTLVVGTGNSGHDVAQDLYVNEAGKVWMLQRSPTCVVSLEPSASMVFNIYEQGKTVEDIDLLTASLPYPVLEDTYKWISKRAAQQDKDLLDRLNAAGFETYYGADDTGFHMMYLRGEGGYYINVGCSDLIADGKVGVIQARNVERFVEKGLLMTDGSVVELDLVVMATGFKNLQEGIRRFVGDTIADKLGPIWGFDQDYQMRNMWRRTPQDGLWVMGGGLIDARLFSRFLAIEIRAALDGVLPDRSAMPIVPR